MPKGFNDLEVEQPEAVHEMFSCTKNTLLLFFKWESDLCYEIKTWLCMYVCQGHSDLSPGYMTKVAASLLIFHILEMPNVFTPQALC